MTYRKKNILTCIIVTLLIIFIYIPVRTGILEKQFIKSVIISSEKIFLSVISYEKDKKLQDKDLSGFYNKIKDKYQIALISIADKKNKILKTGKNDKYIKSNITFDSILDSFIRDEFKINKQNDFVVRYFDQNKFYIFVKYITGGKILLVYPYKFSLRLIIQLILEILLISVFSIILTAIIYIRKNKKNGITHKDIYKYEKKKAEKPVKIHKEESKNTDKKKLEKKAGKTKSKINIDLLSDHVFGLFNYILKEHKPEKISLYLFENNSSLSKIFELKGNSFVKIKDKEVNQPGINSELIEELKKSSIIILDKGRNVTMPILNKDILLGTITVIRSRELSGTEINDIKSRVQEFACPFSECIFDDYSNRVL